MSAIPERSHDVPVVRIRAKRGWSLLGLKELWDYREVVWQFAWRDVQVRYTQTIFGAAWAVVPLRPNSVLMHSLSATLTAPTSALPLSEANWLLSQAALRIAPADGRCRSGVAVSGRS